ncbi:hypothetical protein SAMN04488241_11076 [Sphingomonas rubra]|uniref:DMT family protein n=2 Tax=Sphingomonas rubra TaxID=634430 RepID=A0A1I5U3C2_9SPHN|nr:hypothetical protein SAMN04488241_11076 [Sphingomonas rubra]
MAPAHAGRQRWTRLLRGVQVAATPTILLLTASNIFMTVAWYWHLKGGMNKPLAAVVAISWGIALFEYCLAVPANRLGYSSGWSAGQLKVTQEVIALTVFGMFMVAVLGEPLTWRHGAAFACLVAAAAFLFVGR